MLSHVSHSSLKDSTECPYRFKLRSVDRIRNFQNSIHTIFGNVMHTCIQEHLLGDQNTEKTCKRFKRVWRKFSGLYREHLEFALVKQYLLAGLNIIRHVNQAFEGYSVISAEQEINTPVREGSTVNFKGYIDLLMEHEQRTVIADLKTAKNMNSFKSNLNAIKRYQLAYYQKYFAQQFELGENEIDLLYIVLEKDPDSKHPIQFMPVKNFHGKRQDASEAVIDRALKMVEDNDFPKHRDQCYNAYTGIRCPFYQTQHCT